MNNIEARNKFINSLNEIMDVLLGRIRQGGPIVQELQDMFMNLIRDSNAPWHNDPHLILEALKSFRSMSDMEAKIIFDLISILKSRTPLPPSSNYSQVGNSDVMGLTASEREALRNEIPDSI